MAGKPPTPALFDISCAASRTLYKERLLRALAENRISERATLLSKTMVAIVFGDSIAGCDLRSERKATGSRRVREARWDRSCELRHRAYRKSPFEADGKQHRGRHEASSWQALRQANTGPI